MFVAFTFLTSTFWRVHSCTPRREAQTGVVRSAKSRLEHDTTLTLTSVPLPPRYTPQHNDYTSLSRLEALHLHSEEHRIRTTEHWSDTAEDTAEMAVRRRTSEPEDCEHCGPNQPVDVA